MQPLGTKVYLLKRYSPSDSFCTFFSESVTKSHFPNLFPSIFLFYVSLYGFIFTSFTFINSSHVFPNQTKSSAITVTHFVLRIWWLVLRRAAYSKPWSWHDGHDWFSSATFSCLGLTQCASPTPLWTH